MDREACRSLLQNRFVLFSVEGAAEGEVIRSLIEDDALVVPRDHLVSDHNDPSRLYTRTRKARDIADRYFNMNYRSASADCLVIARIVDTSSGRFELPRRVRNDAEVLSFYTKPEIEMLVIHREGAYRDWERARRRDRSLRPKEFCKMELGLKYVEETAFLRGYWADVDALRKAIQEYAQTTHRERGELLLVDLLK